MKSEDITKLYNALEESNFTVTIIGATGAYTHMFWNCQKPGTKVIQINPSRTQFDQLSDLNIREGSDPVFEELMKLECPGQ